MGLICGQDHEQTRATLARTSRCPNIIIAAITTQPERITFIT